MTGSNAWTASGLDGIRIAPALAYQQGLCTKLGLTAVLLLLAGANRVVLTPQLVAQDSALIRLRRMIVAELLVFAAVIFVTAYLTTYLSPHDATDAAHAHDGEVQPLRLGVNLDALSGNICCGPRGIKCHFASAVV